MHQSDLRQTILLWHRRFFVTLAMLFASICHAQTPETGRPILFVHGFCSDASDWNVLEDQVIDYLTASGSTDAPQYPNKTPYVLYYDGNAVREYPGGVDPRSVPPSDPRYIPQSARFFSINFFAPGAFGSGPINGNAVAEVSILNKADELASVIHAITELTHTKDVIVVGHSLGGLVARTYMQKLGTIPYGQDVAKLITLDTPHGGAAAATLPLEYWDKFSPSCNFSITVNRAELTPSSSFMDLLRRSAGGLPAGTILASIESYTFLGTIPGGFSQDDGVVTKAEQSFTESINGAAPPPSIYYDVPNEFAIVPVNCLIAGTWPLHRLSCLGIQSQTGVIISAEIRKTVSGTAPPNPVIMKGVNAFGGSPIIAPNTWVILKGTNLAPNERTWQDSDFQNASMPTSLDGVSVTMNGKNAFLYYISTTQLNVLTPPDLALGTVQVQVNNNGAVSAAFAVQSQQYSPSFFVFDSTHVTGTHLNGGLLGPLTLYPGFSTPGKPNESLVLYANGFGPTSSPVVSGSVVQSGSLPALPVVKVGGVTANVQFSGLVSPGLYQINIVVPPLVPTGDNSLTASFSGFTTQSGVILAIDAGLPSGGPIFTESFGVPSQTDVALAGASNGRRVGSDSSPLNSPALMRNTVSAGQVLQITATGLVDTTGQTPLTGPDGNTASRVFSTRTLGISEIEGPRGALIGVFLGPNEPDPNATPPNVDFTGASRDLVTLTPLLQQPFYIGRGTTSSGATKNFAVPARATRLFLAVLDSGGSNSDNTGSFTVSVSAVAGPAPILFPNVSAVADIVLAGALAGRSVGRDASPLNSPVLFPTQVSAGQVLQVTATGLVDTTGQTPETGPDGNTASRVFGSRSLGISEIDGPRGALIGVFLGPNEPDPGATPPNVDFTGASRDLVTLTPLLQQPFYIGRGTTSTGTIKNFGAPSGATRLFLAVLDSGGSNSDNTGSFTVSVSAVAGPAPILFPNVSAVADILLAGALAGRSAGSDASPLNSPVLYSTQVSTGQVLQVTATGLVDTSGQTPQTGPDGNTASRVFSTRSLGISEIDGPRGALIGVFLGPNEPDPNATPPNVDFTGASRDLVTLTPLLQQPFYIGRGMTSAGTIKNFVVPSGATRLFFAVLDSGGSNSDNTGSFNVSVSAVAGTAPILFPSVSAGTDITLAGALAGRSVGSDASPLNSPVLYPTQVSAGQVLHLSATGTVDTTGQTPQTGPDGNTASRVFSTRSLGISEIDGPRGALIGVFLGPNAPDPNTTPANVDFTGASRDLVTLTPLLQQPFYIGRGMTSAGATKNFVAPSGATRLFFAVLDSGGSNSDNTGSFIVSVF